MNALLKSLDSRELAILANVPSALIPTATEELSSAILRLAGWARGDDAKVWLDRVTLCSAREAIDVALAILHLNGAGNVTHDNALGKAWKRVLDECDECRMRARTALNSMADLADYGEDPFETDVLRIEETLNRYELPGSPPDEEGWESAKVVIVQLEETARETETMAQMRLEDANQQFSKESNKVATAIMDILAQLQPSASREVRDNARDKLCSLIQPFVGRVGGDAPRTLFPGGFPGFISAARSGNEISKQEESGPPTSGESSLSAYGRLTLRDIHPAERGLTNFEELREQEQRISAIKDPGRRAFDWLAIAKATNNETFRALAIGEGFFEQGEFYLRLRRRGAKDFLRDSARMFAKADLLDDPRLERALLALCVERSHSEYSLADRGYNVDPATWLETPEEMFRWLERGTNFRTLALEWLEVDDQLADRLYAFLEKHVQNHEQLRAQFAALCLMGRELRHRLRRCLFRCGRLLDTLGDRTLSGLWNHLLDAAPNASSVDSIGEDMQFFDTRVRDILTYLGAPSPRIEGLAPIPQLRDGLTHLLERRGVDPGSEGKSLDLDIELMVDCLYPEEHMRECVIPVRVSNPMTNPAVQDVRLKLSLTQRSENIQIEQREDIVGTLLPGDDKERCFYVNFGHAVTEKETEATFRVEWNVGDLVGQSQKKVSIRPSTREGDRSPYNTGGSVIGESFVGRERQLSRVLVALVGSEKPQPVLVYGIRRIGKTSLLKRVLAEPGVQKAFHIVEWDVQDLPDSSTTDEVAVTLCKRVQSALPKRARGGLEFSWARMREDPYGGLESFFDAVRVAAPEKRLLLAIDEFDRMLEVADISERAAAGRTPPLPPTQMFQRRFFGALRKEVMKERGATLLVAGLPRLLHAHSYDDRLFGLFKPVLVGRLDTTEADKIINSSRVLEKMHRLARNRIREATGLQPYLLQVLCQNLFSRMVESGRDPANRGDVDAVIDDVMLPNEKYFSDYVSLIQNDEKLLWALAKATPGLGFATSSEVATVLREIGISEEPARITKVLENYCFDGLGGEERPIIETPGGGRRNRYRFVIGLLKDYLLRRFES